MKTFKTFLLVIFSLFLSFESVQAQTKVQIGYTNEDGKFKWVTSYWDNNHAPLPVHDSIESGYTTLLSASLIDNSPTSATTAAFYVGDKKDVAFSVYYNETEVGATVSGTLTMEVSPDSTTWYDYKTMLYGTRTDTAYSTITFTTDAEEYVYLPTQFRTEYVRLKLTGTNTDVDDTIAITAIAYYRKN